MKLTKQDYMRLKKERLAELLVERDLEEQTRSLPFITPYVPDYEPWAHWPRMPWQENIIYAEQGR